MPPRNTSTDLDGKTFTVKRGPNAQISLRVINAQEGIAEVKIPLTEDEIIDFQTLSSLDIKGNIVEVSRIENGYLLVLKVAEPPLKKPARFLQRMKDKINFVLSGREPHSRRQNLT